MLIGALLDAGLPFDTLRAALGSLALEDECRVSAERVSRSGIGATKFTVTETTGEVGGTHRHRHLPGITKLVDQSALSDSSKQRANRLFRRLAETEATIHQMPVEKVHLHEVGALDSIIDIVGGVFALEWFGADRVVASPINVGSGTVTCEHGTLPVPAPATASLVSGVPVYAAGPPGEMLTPTGALLVTEFAGEYGPLPPMRIEKIGYGAGTRDPAGHPNVLRVLAGEATGTGGVERLAVVECEIDDMNPQIFGVLMDRLYAAGAVDVFYTPVQMKKNRPGTHVTVLVPRERREAVSATLFRESTTIGVRHMDVTRETLRRELVPVSTRFGEVRCKVAWREAVVVNVAPEFDDCARLAEQHGVPVKEVHADAAKAYQDIGGTGRSPV
jgi:hypothetical protein|tara:strand:- start:107 stop:1270 length:1164 start_codon:yes stop_codon:yes gene_type:complete